MVILGCTNPHDFDTNEVSVLFDIGHFEIDFSVEMK